MNVPFPTPTICVPDKRGKPKLIDIRDIVMLKGESNYTLFLLNDGQELLTTRTLRTFVASLSEVFVRIHKSYVVNLNYLTDLQSEPMTLTNGQVVKVARRRRTAFLQAKDMFRQNTSKTKGAIVPRKKKAS